MKEPRSTMGARSPGADPTRTQLTMAALDDVGLAELLRLPAFDLVDRETVSVALGEFVRFMDEVVAPTDHIGDRLGATHDPSTGAVETPLVIREAYRGYVEAGWGAVPFPVEVGGGGFPRLIGTAMQEIFASSNMGLSLCLSLTQSGVELLSSWGTASQRERYIPRLVTGEWTGTMLITESDAGSDVGAIRTRATPIDDGTWMLSGEKIFISWGDHDMSDNIVHMVLARTEGSPPGTRGLSLFVVPKLLVGPDGRPGEPNGVRCLSVEHKLGLHASPTCVMELDGAVGELVGEEHGGIRAMFTMMNSARLSIGLQGLSVGEVAYSEARAFASQRQQGNLPGVGHGDPVLIEEHPDVRRMLAYMRSSLDAMRLVIYNTALHTDYSTHGVDAAARLRSSELVELFTPIAKAWTTDLGFELASLGVQIHGGMGYIEDTRAPQRLRDARIGPIYEGTNGIQAIDLVTRKITMRDGEVVDALLLQIEEFGRQLVDPGDDLTVIGLLLSEAAAATRLAAGWLRGSLAADREAPSSRASSGRDDALAGATTFLAVFGDLVGGWMLARRAADRSRTGPDESGAGAIAAFYAIERLSTVPGRCATVTSGASRIFI